jgi:hypothetical protein
MGKPVTPPKSDESLQPKKMRQLAFLGAYRRMANISNAAAAVGLSREAHYDWLETDPDYPVMFEEAKKHASEVLEEEAFKRATVGGSDTLLIFLLKGAMPLKYRERYSHEVTGKDGKAIEVSYVSATEQLRSGIARLASRKPAEPAT